MPGPGRGGRGRGGHRVGFRHAPLPPPPPRPGLFFGGPGLGPVYRGRGGGRPCGPRGVSCCCWVWMCLIGFVVVSSLGITLIDLVAGCNSSATSDGESGDEMSPSSCYKYELAFAVTVGLVALCCCFCLMRPSDGGYQPIDGTAAERQHMLATEAAPPPPPIVYAEPAPRRYQSLPRASEYQTKV